MLYCNAALLIVHNTSSMRPYTIPWSHLPYTNPLTHLGHIWSSGELSTYTACAEPSPRLSLPNSPYYTCVEGGCRTLRCSRPFFRMNESMTVKWYICIHMSHHFCRLMLDNDILFLKMNSKLIFLSKSQIILITK